MNATTDAKDGIITLTPIFRRFPAVRSVTKAQKAARRNVKVDPKAKLVIDDETGRMALDFDDYEAAKELAEAYGLELDDTLVKLGHCDDMGLPIPYRHLVDRWIMLADVWKKDEYDRFKGEHGQDVQRGAW